MSGAATGDRERLVVYFTKGLEDVVLGELRELCPDLALIDRSERFAIIDVPTAEVDRLEAELRTADDLRKLVGGPERVPDEESFRQLAAAAADRTRAVLADEGRPDAPPWSVTVSAKRPVWRRKPTWSLGPIVAGELGEADIEARERAPVDLRLQADDDLVHLAVNRAERVVGRREDNVARLGALRGSVAAAIVRVALGCAEDEVARRGVYDPFAGTGTIVLEAARLELPVFASDVDPEAIEIVRRRLATLAADHPEIRRGLDDAALLHRVFEHDITAGLPARVDSRVIAGNLPWGTQVELARRTELFDSLAPIAAQAVAEGGSCAFLTTNHEQLMARLRRRVDRELIGALPIGLLGQRPAIVTVRGKRER